MEIAALTELSLEEIVMAMDANREVESLYQPVVGTDGDELLLIDQLAAGERAAGSRRTQCETAKLLSMTQVQVSRKERKILGKLCGRLR